MDNETRRDVVGLTVTGAVFLLGGVLNFVIADALPHPEYATLRSIVLEGFAVMFFGAAEVSGRPHFKRKSEK